jgi:pimeloyl-ACP methyl ester carboxylesterase
VTPKRSVVLLCGLMCDARVWAPQAAALADAFDVTTIDFLGLDSFAAMAERVLARAPDSFALVGHSMGGRVALETFRRAPSRIERLALLDTGVHGVSASEAPGRLQLVELGREQGMRAVAEAWLPPMVGPVGKADAALMADLTDMIENASLEDFAGQQQALLARPDATPLLADVRCPTLVATGRYDAWSPVAQHEDIARQIAGAKLVVFENAGHMCTVETPDDVTRALRDWLD